MTLGNELLWIVPVAIIIAIGLAVYLVRDVLRRETGTAEMMAVSNTIYEGAIAFLRRQYTTIGLLALVTAVIIGTLIALFDRYVEVPGVSSLQFGIETAIAFLLGALLSSISGVVAMWTAVKSNVRVAAAARHGVNQALTVALRGGAVSGFLVVALSLLGVWGLFEIYGRLHANMAAAPFLIIGLGFGASFVALFAQLGGGIYTKAADVGADLVGKVEQGIPEDDPRNPAVVADLVGDNVGDCAGRGADLFESTVAENIGAMILGVAIWRVTNNTGWIVFPLVLRSFGIVASLVGVFVARMRNDAEDPMNALNRGFYISAGLSVLFLALTTYLMLGNVWLNFFGAGLIGLGNAIAFLVITQYYTEGKYRPVRSIAEASKTGTATNIISGLAVGFETTALPVLSISIALLASYALGASAAEALGVSNAVAGIFGTAVATMGMLMTAAYILAMDTFGPIADNAGGIVEMSNAPEEVRAGTDALDAAGNTTKALTKGYAIGSAALAAFLLFSAYLDKVELVVRTKAEAAGLSAEAIEEMARAVHTVDLGKVPVFVGALAGAMLVFLFASLAIRAVGKAAEGMIAEVRRQFRADPGIMAGTSRPDYARAVDISTRAALREMIAPGLLAVGLPIVVGLLLRAEAIAGLLMVGTMAGILVALLMNNGGGAWDNAKKLIEAGKLTDSSGRVLGKGSDAHSAAVVGDTVGDPFKDTAGPSLHVLIKLLATITLVLAPLFI
ncbi:MAG: sodium-translocating pyrophosphatase [Chloroflexi bacterium]|nr:sodium-translocating pyrophosphatase [Chloroflexota bacterium]MCI0578485.1 sodium-translocating pyrophosphatase [Chloroflexota bacterium]MCI0648498.1 sodium-translocating pyrophosphatase [Chloroflexota bacterium]MCI0726022.1 sodium-translocating pyrophosphatase [Chloroflexota bacterium]